MNPIEFEINEMLAKAKRKNIYIKSNVSSISITEYAEQSCYDLKEDIKMISLYFNLNAKQLYKKFVVFCFERTYKKPRLRVDHKNKRVELYNERKNNCIVVFQIDISRIEK